MYAGMRRFIASHPTAWVFLCCLAAYALLHGWHVPDYVTNPRHKHSGDLLLTTPDGYYFLRQAADVSMGLYGPVDPARPVPRPAMPPLPSLAAVAVHSLLGVSLMNAAFFIPPALAFGLVLATWLLGAAVGRPREGLMAGVAASASYLWYTRVCIGAFDTDCLILPLLVGAMVCLRLSMDKPLLRWLGWMAPGATQLALLALWWPQGGKALTALCLGVYAASCVFPGRRGERLLKAALLVAGTALLAYLALGHPTGVLEVASQSVKQHLGMILKDQPGNFGETGDTIAELTVSIPLDAADYVSGHWLVFIAAACGAVAFAVRHPRMAFMVVLPLLTLGAASLWGGNRFLMYLAPVHGLGLVWFCSDLLLPRLRRIGAPAPVALAVLAGLLLAAPSAWDSMTERFLPTHDYNAVELASVINRKTPPNAFVWNWWGPGYMMEYYTRRECLIDGGLQLPVQTYISAVPFASNNAELARNWIKFFSVHRDGLSIMAQYFGGGWQSVAFLREVFAAPQRLDELLDKHGLPRDVDWKALLFPEREVYVIMLSEMLLRSTWNSLGRWDPVAKTGPDVRIFLTPLDQVAVNPDKGIAVSSSGDSIAYSRIYFVSPDNLSYDEARSVGPVAMHIWGTPYFYTIEQEYFDCLAYRLLFVHPENTPGFEAVVYNPFIGGVWKVH